jgi:hypothetical protein
VSDLLRVAVVRPKQGPDYWAVRIAVGVALTALIGWWLMLIAGAVTPWHPSYWHSILALVGLRMVQVGSGWSNWTHPFGKSS